ncbi:MAG: shikimate dehydrogenase [Methanospirillaceae archaeon]|nr:shikimate dehydrogenase [Methanospirillaceae archaeon]
MSSNRIVLIGYRGTGKTTIGKRLAELLDLLFCDTDQEIKKTLGVSIPDLFAGYGEEAFREIEHDTIAAIPPNVSIVSTGGGAVLDPENREFLRRKSTIFWLMADPETIFERIEKSDRPALSSLPLHSEIEKMLCVRTPIYRSLADYTIKTDTKSIDACVREIAFLYASGGEVMKTREDWIFSHPLPASCNPDAMRNLITTIDNPRVRIFGILGYPCGHSRSPQVWNRLFSHFGMDNALYTWFEQKNPDLILHTAYAMGIKGLSVTIPHKETVIPFCDEIKHDARTIGAVNTILFSEGRSFGFNTDWLGIYRPLEGYTGGSACVIGAGGAASAAVYALMMRGYEVTILNRTEKKAEDLARRFGCSFGPLGDGDVSSYDLVLNATPVGMHPDTGIPVDPATLHQGMILFDLVYTPERTPFIIAGEKAGCIIIPGTEMFISQLAEQFTILTGLRVSTDQVREILA